MKKKFFLGGGLLLLALIVSTPLVFAENVEGWLWGGGVTPNPSGYQGMGWISGTSNNQPGGASYAINIPENDGNVSGYAWSEHYGWIDFDPSNPYPAAPNHNVRRDGDMLKGWARIVAIQDEGLNSGGWEGWIKMSGSGWGVDVTKFGTSEKTYAYSDELGWIDFSRLGAVIELDTLTICTSSGNKITEGSSVSGVDIERSLGQEKSEVLVAHYGDQDCDSDEVDASWGEQYTSGDADDKVSLSDENGSDLSATSTVRVTAGDTSGSENVTVTYNPGTGDITKTLQYTVGDSTSGGGESPVEVEGFRWREVAP